MLGVLGFFPRHLILVSRFAHFHIHPHATHITEKDAPAANHGMSSVDTTSLQDKSFGPKTAKMPDLTKYPSAKMRDVIDVGSLPEHLKDKAWHMLEKRVSTFGFDG